MLDTLCPQHTAGVKGFSLRGCLQSNGSGQGEGKQKISVQEGSQILSWKQAAPGGVTAWEVLLWGTGDLVFCSSKGG